MINENKHLIIKTTYFFKNSSTKRILTKMGVCVKKFMYCTPQGKLLTTCSFRASLCAFCPSWAWTTFSRALHRNRRFYRRHHLPSLVRRQRRISCPSWTRSDPSCRCLLYLSWSFRPSGGNCNVVKGVVLLLWFVLSHT